jgi:hypothetical protein
MIGVVIGLPFAGLLLAISVTSRPDLSNLIPIKSSEGNHILLHWSALLRDHPQSLDAGSPLFNGAPVQALGYMIESDRASAEGESVLDFVLLPDAGNLFHPAHQFGDQMIAVHLDPDARARFVSRALVWVWGTFRASAGDPAGSKPLYALDRAHVQPANKEEIPKYFKDN